MNAPSGAVLPPRPAVAQPPPMAAASSPAPMAPPRASPTQAMPEAGFQNPGVAVPRAAQVPVNAAEPRPGSVPTPAYGTEAHGARPLPAAPGQPRRDAPPAQASASSGLPRMEAPAQPSSGLPRRDAERAPGLPLMDAPAQSAASSGLPRMDAPVQASASSGLPRRDAAPSQGQPLMEDPALLPPLETPAFAAASLSPTPGVSRMEASPSPAAPVKKSQAPAAAPVAGEVHARPASLWRRLLSFTIDTAAIGAVAAAYIVLASSIAGVKGPQPGLTGLDAFVAWLRALHTVLLPGVVLVLVLATVYCAVAAFLWNGRTLGRLLLGLRLVDTHGMAPTPGRAIFRALLAGLSFVLFLGGFWMALFDRRGQTLHDKLTSTFVVQPS
ncbi:RDD family protein [Corallococcus llansteffanensis]|nr:RDD family protein [Corallococcus llansteffanensis]